MGHWIRSTVSVWWLVWSWWLVGQLALVGLLLSVFDFSGEDLRVAGVGLIAEAAQDFAS